MAAAFNRSRMKALVHYVCARVQDKSQLGSVKLNKILWYTDLASYVETGESVTGATYIKKPHGPVASELAGVLEELSDEGALKISTVSRLGNRQKQYVPLVDPDVSKLEPSDLYHAEQVIDRIAEEYTASEISEESHNLTWSLAADGEEIPLEAVYAGKWVTIDESHVRWAKKEMSVSA